MQPHLSLSLALALALACSAHAQDGVPVPAPAPKRDLAVLLVGDGEGARHEAFASWIRSRFRKGAAIARKDFEPSSATGYDVVLLDWQQSARKEYGMDESPLGKRSAWSTPTVLLGSAGLLMAMRWETEGWFG